VVPLTLNGAAMHLFDADSQQSIASAAVRESAQPMR
jgi:hypothetical protein